MRVRTAFHLSGLAAAVLVTGAVLASGGTAAASPADDTQDTYSTAHCALKGNKICGPGNSEGAPAGCYTGGHLDIAWSNYSEPRSDLLWARGYNAQGRYSTCAEIWDQSVTQRRSLSNVQDFPGGMYVTLGLSTGDVTITCLDDVTECSADQVARNARL